MGIVISPASPESQIFAEDACRICAELGPHALYKAREMMFGLRDQFEYFECRNCRCVQLRSPPEDLSTYYPKDYYAHDASPEQQFGSLLRGWLLRERARYAITGRGLAGKFAFQRKPEHGCAALRRLHPSRTTSILDVGCGTGTRLYALRELGFQNLLGVDPHIERDYCYSNGLRVETKELAQAEGEWDIVMFHHAFEHVANPLETLRMVKDRLAAQGCCILRIPVADGFAWQHYRADWVQLDAPRHLFLHTRKSIATLCAKAGLRIDAVRYDSTDFQFLGSELYKRNIALCDSGGTRLFTDPQVKELQREAGRLNQTENGDSAAFYLRRLESLN